MFESLAFASPYVLLGLAGAPLLYLLLRVTPPPPQRIAFPPLKLILDQQKPDATPARTPWWLLLLRIVLAALIVLAMAGPALNPPSAAAGSGPLLLLIDDVWPAAPDWDARMRAAQARLEMAGRDGRAAALLALSEKPAPVLEDSGAALARLRALAPKPILPSRQMALPRIEAFLHDHPRSNVVWLSDAQEDADGRAFAQKLAALAPDAEVLVTNRAGRALAGASNEAASLDIKVLRAAAAPDGKVLAFDAKGASLGEADFAFAGATETTARLVLPLQLRNDVARLTISGEASAGATFLLDAGAQRRRVALVAGASGEQPLLSPLYYLRRALSPYADLREARPGAADPIGALIDEGADVLVIADMTLATPGLHKKLDDFLDAGGTIVRFAGPRLAAASDEFLPVKLRRGGRTLGGALSWEQPKKLAPFDEKSPFYGLVPPDEAEVTRQVLAEPEEGLPGKTWARLADGTPLVTAERRREGELILFHVAADSNWSNVPLSGLFVDMLRKILARAGHVGKVGGDDSAKSLAPLQSLDGFGVLVAPAPTVKPLPGKGVIAPDADHPPGLYGPPESPRALNALAPGEKLAPLDLSGLRLRRIEANATTSVDLRPPLLVAALLLALADALASLLLGGHWRQVGRRAGATLAALLLLLPLFLVPSQVKAEDRAKIQDRAKTEERVKTEDRAKTDMASALQTTLAYVVTGDDRADRISREGLSTLSEVLAQRTALTPGAPRGLDPARDELAFYPLIYWPVSADLPQPDADVVRKIAAYMKQGGLVLFDTRDAALQFAGGPPTPAQDWLRKFLRGLDAPPLEPAPKNHVIFRTFYLLEGLIGRTETGVTFLEALPPETEGVKAPARAGDGVSPLIVASNDLAAAWAGNAYGEGRYPLEPGDWRQREMALRGGVNIVMYTLTGNYKADQVHVPELLERLGQ